MRQKPAAIKDVIEEVLRNLRPGNISRAGVLTSSWARAIGEENMKHARPVEVKGKTLIVHVDSSSWLHKLTMEKARLLALLREDLGEDILEDIKLRIGVL